MNLHLRLLEIPILRTNHLGILLNEILVNEKIGRWYQYSITIKKADVGSSYVLLLFINLRGVAAMLPIMSELSEILWSKSAYILEFLRLLEKEGKGITILL